MSTKIPGRLYVALINFNGMKTHLGDLHSTIEDKKLFSRILHEIITQIGD